MPELQRLTSTILSVSILSIEFPCFFFKLRDLFLEIFDTFYVRYHKAKYNLFYSQQQLFFFLLKKGSHINDALNIICNKEQLFHAFRY